MQTYAGGEGVPLGLPTLFVPRAQALGLVFMVLGAAVTLAKRG